MKTYYIHKELLTERFKNNGDILDQTERLVIDERENIPAFSESYGNIKSFVTYSLYSDNKYESFEKAQEALKLIKSGVKL